MNERFEDVPDSFWDDPFEVYEYFYEEYRNTPYEPIIEFADPAEFWSDTCWQNNS